MRPRSAASGLLPPSKYVAAVAPSATITSGWIASIWRKRNGDAGVGLDRLGNPILRRSAFDDVRDVDLIAAQAHGVDHVVEQLAGAADERQALRVLIGARTFADEHQPRVRVAVAEDNGVAALVKRAARARAHVVANRLQGGGAIFGCGENARLNQSLRGLQGRLQSGRGGRGIFFCNSDWFIFTARGIASVEIEDPQVAEVSNAPANGGFGFRREPGRQA